MKRRIKKNKEEIFKKVKDSIMVEEIVNKNFEKTSNSIKSPDEAADIVNNMEKLLEVRNPTYYGLHTKNVKSLENSKQMKILDMFKELGSSKSTILFKIFIAKFVNKYPRMKKSSLSLHFLKNNFKIIKEICYENASDFK